MTSVPTPDDAARQQAALLHEVDASLAPLGITVDAVGAGRASASMTVAEHMLQGHGTCHGGYLFLLADTAFAYACNTRGPAAVAAGADVAFLAPALLGDVLVATATERVVRGRSGLYDVTVRRGEEVLVELRGRSRSR